MARPKSDIRERILEAAHRRFLAEGVDAASLRAIAKDAETSIGMVYYYYSTKDELFLAVVEETYSRVLSDLEAVFQQNNGFRERLIELYRRLAQFSTHEIEIMQLIVRESLTSNERRSRLLHRFMRGHLPLLWCAVDSARKTGELDGSIHPFVAMACSMAIGAIPILMLRNVNTTADGEMAPCHWHENAVAFLETLPPCDALPEVLGEIALRALGGMLGVNAARRPLDVTTRAKDVNPA